MSQRQIVEIKVFDAQTADGVSGGSNAEKGILVGDFRHVNIVLFNTSGTTTTATVQVRGSYREYTKTGNPLVTDLTAAISVTNLWDYIELIDLQNGSPIDGDTGVQYAAAAEGVRQFAVNTDGLQSIALEISGYTAGEITAYVSATDNN